MYSSGNKTQEVSKVFALNIEGCLNDFAEYVSLLKIEAAEITSLRCRLQNGNSDEGDQIKYSELKPVPKGLLEAFNVILSELKSNMNTIKYNREEISQIIYGCASVGYETPKGGFVSGK